MKRVILVCIILLHIFDIKAQTTLSECHIMAENNYPLIANFDLITKSTQYSLSNIARSWLPQATLSTQASYQSDVASFPSKIHDAYQAMGVNMKGLNKDQYRISLDVYQTIWDGGSSKAERRAAMIEDEVNHASNVVDIYAIRERVNNLFFGVLLSEAQLSQNDIQQELLTSNLDRLKSYLANGVAMQSDLDAVEVELLTLKQQRIKLEANKEAYLIMLSLFTGTCITSLKMPEEVNVNTSDIKRPELAYLDKLNQKYEAQTDAIKASLNPKIGVSLQGFYGNPGLNLFKDMIENRWTINGIAAVKFQWNFGGYYTKKNKLQKIDIAKKGVEVQRDLFLFNSKLVTSQQERDIMRIKAQMNEDERIVTLRISVRRACESKLDNGIIEVNDLVREITAEGNARINERLHLIELLKTIYDLKYSVNN